MTQAQERYESLSRQLLQETAHQREAFKKDQAQLTSQLKFAERRIATLDAEHERLDGELAKERETRRQAIAESLAYQAVNASQHAQLEELMRVVASVEPARRASGPAAGLTTAKRTRAKKA